MMVLPNAKFSLPNRHELESGLEQSICHQYACNREAHILVLARLPHKGERGGGRVQIRAVTCSVLQAIPDTTGREDLARSMREALLLSAARQRGVTR